jgi:hypothetical protein
MSHHLHRYHLVRTLRLSDPLPTDACSLKVTANLISAAAAWVKVDRPRQIAFVLEHVCDANTSVNMSFGMLKGRDAGLTQLLRGIHDDAGQVSPFLFVLRSFVHFICRPQAIYEARLCCASKGICQVLPKSDYDYSSGELSDLELGYEEESASYHFDSVDVNGKKGKSYCYLEGEYHGENVFLKVESVDEIALRFHCKAADERPVFDDPNWQ